MKNTLEIHINFRETDNYRIINEWSNMPDRDGRKINLAKAGFAQYVSTGLFPIAHDFLSSMIGLIIC